MSQVGKINLYDSTSGGGTPQLKLFTDSTNKQNVTAATNLTLTTTSGNINFVNTADTTKNITDVGGVISTAVSTNTVQSTSLSNHSTSLANHATSLATHSSTLVTNLSTTNSLSTALDTSLSTTDSTNVVQSTALSILEINKSVDSVVFVSANYDGGNSDGSNLKPYTTIADAISNASSGDTIYLYDGSYTLDGSSDVLPTDKTLTFQGESMEKTIVSSGSLTKDCFYQGNSSVTNYSYYFNDLTVKDSKYGIRVKSANECIIKRCKFIHNGWNGTAASEETQSAYATLWAGSNTSDGGATRIQSCSVLGEIRQCICTENVRGLRLQDCENAIIAYNKSFKNLDPGIYFADSSTPSGGSVASDGNRQGTIIGNISYQNKNNGILINGGAWATIVANDVYENYNTGVQLYNTETCNVNGNIIRDNCQKSYNGIGNNGDSRGGLATTGTSSDASYYATINGNTITGNLQGALSEAVGIYINNSDSGTGRYVYVGDNVIEDQTTSISDSNSLTRVKLDIAINSHSTLASASLSTNLSTTNSLSTALSTGLSTTDSTNVIQSTSLSNHSTSLANHATSLSTHSSTLVTNLSTTNSLSTALDTSLSTTDSTVASTILIANSASAAAAAIIAGVGTDLDTLSEIVTAYTSLDTSAVSVVTSLTTLVTELSTTLSTLTE